MIGVFFCFSLKLLCISAGGGMGKSTSMKYVAVTWGDGTESSLEKFQFIFHIALKHVKGNSSIENIIIAQHSGLKANKVQPAEIKSILEGENKVLLLIDGHDEYKTGQNIDIDEAIKKESLWNCWMLLTSRETEQIKDIKEFMDAEAEIKGFDEINVEAYITRSLGSEEKTKDLLKQARNCKLIGSWDYGILTIPILLNMVCVLFKCNKSLPSTRTGIAQAIVDRCIDREAIRAEGQKAVDSAKQALYNLGKLAWHGLNEPGKKLVFDKVSEEILFYVLSFTLRLFIKLL